MLRISCRRTRFSSALISPDLRYNVVFNPVVDNPSSSCCTCAGRPWRRKPGIENSDISRLVDCLHG